jgi:YbbR domain-containing protein
LRVIPLDVVQPDSISVMLKEKAEAVLPVTPQLRVNTDAGYILATKPTTIPAQVRVIGPKDQLDELETIKTVFAQVDEARKSGEVVLDLAAPAPYGYRFLPEQVRVIYQVERLTEREFKNVQVSADHVPQGRRLLLEPQTVAISAVGSVTALAALKAANITAWVDYEECNQVSGRATVHIRLPEGISTKRLVPSEVKVMVRRE